MFYYDKEKMIDFHKLSKKEFLECYSYLKEKEYDDTRDMEFMANDINSLSFANSEQKPYTLNGNETYIELFEIICDSYHSVPVSSVSNDEVVSIIKRLGLNVSVDTIRELNIAFAEGM